MVLGVHTYYTYPTKFGPLTIGVDGDNVVALAFGKVRLVGEFRPSAASTLAANQIMEYLSGRRTAFSLPLKPEGTTFQQRVWEAVQNIPYGQTRTARDIAEIVGSPDSFRMVGGALKRCPLPLLIPIHRIVSPAGKPTGSGHSADINAALLALERRELLKAKRS